MQSHSLLFASAVFLVSCHLSYAELAEITHRDIPFWSNLFRKTAEPPYSSRNPRSCSESSESFSESSGWIGMGMVFLSEALPFPLTLDFVPFCRCSFFNGGASL